MSGNSLQAQLKAKPEELYEMNTTTDKTCSCYPNGQIRAGCEVHDPRPDNLPYPFCFGAPLFKDCAGKTSCRRNRACND